MRAYKVVRNVRGRYYSAIIGSKTYSAGGNGFMVEYQVGRETYPKNGTDALYCFRDKSKADIFCINWNSANTYECYEVWEVEVTGVSTPKFLGKITYAFLKIVDFWKTKKQHHKLTEDIKMEVPVERLSFCSL